MKNFVEVYNPSTTVIVSSDIAGVFGHPDEAVDFWSEIFGPNITVNLEMIAWKWILGILDSPRKHQIAGFHGRTGVETFAFEHSLDWMKLACIRQLLTPTGKLLSKINSDKYLLLHVPEAIQQLETITKHYQTSANKPVLCIENHPRPKESHITAKMLVEGLNAVDIPALVTLDLVHFLRGIDASVCLEQKLDMLIAELETMEKCMLHVPIGTLYFDSLPLDRIRKSAFIKIGDIVQRYENIITLEHQLANPIDQILPPIPIAWRRNLKKRAESVISVLINTGILKFRHGI